MLLSRANLLAAELASRNKRDLQMHQLHVEPDGTTVASDGAVMLVVQGVRERPPSLPDFDGEAKAEEASREGDGFGLPPAVSNQAMKNMPRGALGLELGFAAVTRLEEGRGAVELTTTDMNRNHKVEGKKARRRFPEWKPILRGARRSGGDVRKVCVDRRSLAKLLKVMDIACPDPENAVFMEIGEEGGILLRAVSMSTGQSVVGYAMGMNTRGQWLPTSEWEKSIFASKPKKKKKVAKRRKVDG